MEWLNLRLADVRSPEFVGSEPVERSTWLSVLTYCVDQENGGVIVGGAGWKDRQWQQTCGVTSREVTRATKLIQVVGEDIEVRFYPLDKERIVKQKREIGRRGGQASGEARSKHTVEANAEPSAATEGKGEENRKDRTHTPQENLRSAPTLEVVLAHANTAGISKDCAEKFYHLAEARPLAPSGAWMNPDETEMHSWQSALQAYWLGWKQRDARGAAPTNPRRQRTSAYAKDLTGDWS